MDLYQVNKKVFSYLSQRKTMYFGDIYHYTSPLGLKGIIEDSVVWFSDMRFLNDASEIIYIYKIAYETIHKMEINNDLKNMVEAICYSLHNTGCYLDDNKEIIPIDNYYLASFSKDPDNLNLWNYYTKSQNSIGYNICIDINNSLEINNRQRIVKGEVIYDTEEQIDLLKKCFTQYSQFIDNINNNLVDEVALKRSIIDILKLYNLFFKPSAYALENEYRFVILNNNENDLKFRINNGILIPYIPIKLKKDAIKSISISPSNEQELAELGLKDFIKQHDKFITAEIKKSEIPKRY